MKGIGGIKRQKFARFAICLLALGLFFLADQTFAATVGGVSGTVVNDGAQVYDKPDFDGKILGRIHEGRKVRVSKGITGRSAKFRKIKIGKRFGYISTMDVSVGGRVPASLDSKGVVGGSIESHTKRRRKNALPIFYSKFFGLTGGIAQYHESVGGSEQSTSLPVYGIKFTGTDVLFLGPVIDFNFLIHYGAPSYYSSLSTIQPSGFFLLTDALLELPFLQRQDFTGLFGVGPLIKYQSYRTFNGVSSQDSSEFGIGASFMLGAVYRVGSVALRVDGKYYIEKHAYPGAMFSLLTGF